MIAPTPTVEDDVVGVLVEHLVHREGPQPLLAACAFEVEVTLHDVELAVYLRQPALRLDDDQAVHAGGNVVRDRWRRAVVDVDAGVQRLEAERC